MAEYIERGALDKALTIAAANGKDKDRRTWAKAICVLHDMPAADVAPVVHGEWRENRLNGYAYAFICSKCGYIDGYPFNDRHRYCPNCGTKMDGGVSE